MWDYKDIRLITLHRMLEATAMDIPCDIPDGFSLNAYISSGELDFAAGGEIKLKAIFGKDAAFHLNERHLVKIKKWERKTMTVGW